MHYAVGNTTSNPDIRRCIERIYQLPPMPGMARTILDLRLKPAVSAADLAKIVELDPSLCALIVRCAGSSLFGCCGGISSIRDAISRVLGVEAVMNIALGFAAAKALRNPLDGPLGMRAFWRHAVYSAALTQGLARAMPAAERPGLEMAYPAGLLHNFGFLLLGHLFPPEFALLNKLVMANPDVPVTILEKHLLGMGQAQRVLCLGHAQIGAWLMEYWGMPEEIVVSLREHHNPQYQEEHSLYPNLVLLADHLLKGCEIGDAPNGELPQDLLARLGLDEQQVMAVRDRLLAGCEGLDSFAHQIAA